MTVRFSGILPVGPYDYPNRYDGIWALAEQAGGAVIGPRAESKDVFIAYGPEGRVLNGMLQLERQYPPTGKTFKISQTLRAFTQRLEELFIQYMPANTHFDGEFDPQSVAADTPQETVLKALRVADEQYSLPGLDQEIDQLETFFRDNL